MTVNCSYTSPSGFVMSWTNARMNGQLPDVRKSSEIITNLNHRYKIVCPTCLRRYGSMSSEWIDTLMKYKEIQLGIDCGYCYNRHEVLIRLQIPRQISWKSLIFTVLLSINPDK